MTTKHRFIRSLIRWLLDRYPYQVRDILAEKGKHVHSNPKKPKPVQNPPVTGLTMVGQSHTAHMAQGGEA